MKSLIKTLMLTGIFFATMADAKEQQNKSPLHLSLAGGYVQYKDMFGNDGNTVAERIALGLDVQKFSPVMFGFEAGVQSGNRMRLNVSQATVDSAFGGGLLLQGTIKTLADFLLTAQMPVSKDERYALFVKGGVAYRKIQTDRDTIANKTGINAEAQLGLAVTMNARTAFQVFYQGIYGGGLKFSANTTTNTGTIGHIPTQQGLFVGVNITV